MNKLVACAFAAVLCSANADVIDLTAEARALGKTAYAVSESSTRTKDGYAGAEFDGSWKYSNNIWHSDPDAENPLDQWAQIQFKDAFHPGEYFCVRSYAVYYSKGGSGDGTARYPRKLPKTWTFEASNDGVTWIVLDSQTDWNKWSSDTWSTFPVVTSECYRYYRLHMTAICNTDPAHQHYAVGEIKINGEIYASEEEAKKVRIWSGKVSTDWFDAGNWEPASLPQEGGSVTVSGGLTAVLTNSTPALKRLDVAGTLETRNWMTKVSASNVAVASGGKITCAGPFNDTTDMSNRVWIACEDLAVASGGSINVDGKGYGTETVMPKYTPTMGPCKWPYPLTSSFGSSVGYGGSYGGNGGTGFGNLTIVPLPYGSASEPTDPGSSGCSSYYDMALKAGGGAVRIDATGIVTVDGTISANGADGGSTSCPGGSGGAILIHCDTFKGANGTVSVQGGSGAWNGRSTAGGGGRIAIHYNSANQTAEMAKTVRLWAAPGSCTTSGYTTLATMAKISNSYVEQDLGTLWTTDNTLLSGLGSTVCGQLPNVQSLELDELEMKTGYVRFTAEGVKIKIKGDLAVVGTNARFDIGGGTRVRPDAKGPQFNRHTFFSGAIAPEVEVGGNLTISNSAAMVFYPAHDTSEIKCGGRVTVGGDFVLADNACLYPWCNPTNGAGVVFTAENIRIAETATVNANSRGFGGGTYYCLNRTNGDYPGSGPGRGTATYSGAEGATKNVGGAYGSDTPRGSATYGKAYGDAYRPTLPGSGGGAAGGNGSSYGNSGAGGGLIWLRARNSLVVDGTLQANGGATGDTRGSPGSGGGILLEGATVAASATAVISANGGAATSTAANNDGASGGRIAVWDGVELWHEKVTRGRVKHTSVRPESFLAEPTVDGGVYSSTLYGNPGTITYNHLGPVMGMLLLVR